jgi:hypothetical protein
MIRNIYLHIGLPKTGSSSIQVSLAKSSQFLKDNGYLYPLFSNGEHVFLNHSVPFKQIFSVDSEMEQSKKIYIFSSDGVITNLKTFYLQQLVDQIENFSGENLIISGENIGFLKLDELNNLRQFFFDRINNKINIHVIVFVRNPLTRIQSIIQQRIKGGQILKLVTPEIIRSSKTFFANYFSKLMEVFPINEFKILRYEDTFNHAKGLVGLFLSSIGFNELLMDKIELKYANQSISHEATVLISAINQFCPQLKERKLNETYYSDLIERLLKIPGPKFSISSDLRLEVWENSIEDIKWLSETFSTKLYEYFDDNECNEERWGVETFKYVEEIFPTLDGEIKGIILEEIHKECNHNNEFHRMKLDDLSLKIQ